MHLDFNGSNYTKNYFCHEDLLKGGLMKVQMGDQPNHNRGTKDDDAPYSFSKELKK